MKKTTLMAMLVLATGAAQANVTLHGLFTDHMVLQREAPLAVSGQAEPGEKVTVTYAGRSQATVAGQNGTWSVTLKAMKASTNAAPFTVQGKNTIVLQDVVVGDVWVCSGQSNMEFGLGGCQRPADVQSADFPLLRQFHVPRRQAAAPCDQVQGAWVVCSPQTAAGFTAVGFYFARQVYKTTGVPIGLINASWGGTPIEPWVAPAGLALVPQAMRQEIPIGAPHVWHELYFGMIHPLTRLPIKGALWYQGESNAIFNQDPNREESYLAKEKALISSWRKAWGVGDFPFYLVQLASFQPPNNGPEGGQPWARICMAQFRALTIPHTGMAVAIDLADPGNPGDIHPKNKKDVGERLALWALAKDYGKKVPAYSGPLYQSMKVEGHKIRLRFDSVGSGLVVARKSGYEPPVQEPRGKLQRFAIAGADRKWVWADAVIDGKTVVVSSPEVPNPVAVRYAFATNPEGCNLYNKEGLPASPFRTDAW